jgi:hypothetical protein
MPGRWVLRFSRMVGMARRRSTGSSPDCEEVPRFGHPVPCPVATLGGCWHARLCRFIPVTFDGCSPPRDRPPHRHCSDHLRERR